MRVERMMYAYPQWTKAAMVAEIRSVAQSLCLEIRRLRRELRQVSDLLAAARAASGALAHGEDDPLWYLRDEAWAGYETTPQRPEPGEGERPRGGGGHVGS